jgi:predicted GNAT family acetyltransferase
MYKKDFITKNNGLKFKKINLFFKSIGQQTVEVLNFAKLKNAFNIEILDDKIEFCYLEKNKKSYFEHKFNFQPKFWHGEIEFKSVDYVFTDTDNQKSYGKIADIEILSNTEFSAYGYIYQKMEG